MHPLSLEIGRILCELHLPDAEVLLGSECGGKEKVQLFCGEPPTFKTRLICADAAIRIKNEIKIVLEIEESKIDPVQFFGKAFATAGCTFYCGLRGRYPISGELLFIQVLIKRDTDRSKEEQCRNIERVMSEMCKGTRIAKYAFHWGTPAEYRDKPNHAKDLHAEIHAFLALPVILHPEAKDISQQQ